MVEQKNSDGMEKKRYEDFYRKLRVRIRKWLDERETEHKWAEILLLAPDLFHLLVCLLFDKDVPEREKTKILMAVAYFISPLDLLPELLLGPVAFVDDIAIACFILNSLMKNVEPEVIERHWAGEDDLLELVAIVVSRGDAWLGSGLFRRIKGYLDKTEKKQK